MGVPLPLAIELANLQTFVQKFTSTSKIEVYFANPHHNTFRLKAGHLSAPKAASEATKSRDNSRRHISKHFYTTSNLSCIICRTSRCIPSNGVSRTSTILVEQFGCARSQRSHFISLTHEPKRVGRARDEEQAMFEKRESVYEYGRACTIARIIQKGEYDGSAEALR
jgi:hypothetical protein